MEIKKVTLIGLGAMGAFFAPKLEAYLGKENFRVLADGERKQRLESKGVTINGVTHYFNVISPEVQADVADLIIVAVKDTGLTQAIQDIQGQVGEHTQILCVMNGIDSEERMAAAYGWDHVLYSFMRVSIGMKDGVANFDPEIGKVHFGEAKNDEPSERVKAIQTLFDVAKIKYTVEPDMIRSMWLKFMCNIGENMTCAMLGISYGAFHVSEHANAIRRRAMREVIAIANRKGIALGEEDIERQEAVVKRLPADNKPSTLQDLEKGNQTETEMFAGKVVQIGESLGIETPLNWMFYNSIKVHEEKNVGRF